MGWNILNLSGEAQHSEHLPLYVGTAAHLRNPHSQWRCVQYCSQLEASNPAGSPWSEDSKSTVVPEYCTEHVGQNHLHGATRDAASLLVSHLDLTSSF